MTHFSTNLRSFEDDGTDHTLVLLSKNSKYTLFGITKTLSLLPLLKTVDVTVKNISHPWQMTLNIHNEKERDVVSTIDKLVVGLVRTESQRILGDEFTVEEIYNENVFIPSLSETELAVYCLKKDTNEISAIPTFSLYEPSKFIINTDRLVPDVICRCALKPWFVQVYTKIRRFRVLWVLEQCMLLEEPMNSNCVLDADDEDEVVVCV